MNKFKYLGVFSIIFILILVAGCSGDTNKGKEKENNDRTKVLFWDFHVDEEREFFEEAVKEYNESQDKVEVEFVTINQGDYTTTKLPTAFANREGPDVFLVEPSVFLKYAQAGILADLTNYFKDDILSDFQESAIEAVTYGDKILALPFEQELLALFYNKQMLEEANVEVPQTWDELYEAAKKLNNDKVAGIVLPSEKIPYTNFNFYPFLWQAGGDVISADGTESVFESLEAAEALDFWGSFFKDGLSPTKLQMGPWDIGNVGTGIAAMQVMGTFGINDTETKFTDVEFGVAPLPHPEGKESVTVAGGQSLAVNSSSENIDAAADFVMWLFGSEDIKYASKWVTEAKFSYPPRKSIVEANADVYSKGLRNVFTEEIYDTAIPEPQLPSNISDVLGDALQNVMFKNMTGEQASKEAHDKISSSLKE